MKLKCNFDFVELDGQFMAIPEDKDAFPNMLRLNETAAEILKLLENETTEAQVVEEILKSYKGEKEEIENYVHSYIESLNEMGVIE